MLNVYIILPVLFYAGYTDFKSRAISNKVSIILVTTGIIEIAFFSQYFRVTVAERLAVGLLFLFVFLIIYKINPNISGGGDLKLLSSAGFCLGFDMFYVLFFGCITGIAYALIIRRKGERLRAISVPMGTCVAVGAFIFVIFNFVFN